MKHFLPKNVALQFRAHLPIAPEIAIEKVQLVKLMQFVSLPIIKFMPQGGDKFPERWNLGRQSVSLFAFGFIPLGHQHIDIEVESISPSQFKARDNGSGFIAKVWDHQVLISPMKQGSLYQDIVRVEAGTLTIFVWIFAHIFYRWRQYRWRKLIKGNFSGLQEV